MKTCASSIVFEGFVYSDDDKRSDTREKPIIPETGIHCDGA